MDRRVRRATTGCTRCESRFDCSGFTLRERSGIRLDVQLEEVVHAQEAESQALDRPDLLPRLVMEHMWRCQLDMPSAGEKLASTCCEDVLQPVRVRTIGQRHDVAATWPREHVDRRPVPLAGPASAMN